MRLPLYIGASDASGLLGRAGRLALAACVSLSLAACGQARQTGQATTPGASAGSVAAGSTAGSADSLLLEAIYTNETYGFAFDPSFCPDLEMVSEAQDAAVYRSESWGMTLYVQGVENVEGYDARALVDAITLQAKVPDGNPTVGDGFCVVQQLENPNMVAAARVEGGAQEGAADGVGAAATGAAPDGAAGEAQGTATPAPAEGEAQSVAADQGEGSAAAPASEAGDVVATYVFFIGKGNYQGIVCEFDPDVFETLTADQGAELVAAFLPGNLDAVHEDLRSATSK